jgi:anaerobic selenocysteine-containing dehydrogenase
MGLTRRQFLKWSGASALGAVVFNGCNIPSEELQIVSPVEMPEELALGRDNWYATVCGQDAGSGVIVRVVDGRAKKIEGNPDYPTNQGKHSVRSEAGLQALYHPDRLASPKYRSQRSGEFSDISWDEARLILTENLKNENITLITDPLNGHLALLIDEFTKGSGATYKAFSSVEEGNLGNAVQAVFGESRIPDFDIANSKYILSFGADFLSTWQSPVRYSTGYGEFRQGGSVRGTHVHVDSRFSMTAANADDWVPVKPGGEGVLALSIAYVIIRDGLAPSAIVSKLTDGEGSDYLSAFDPANGDVQKATGVDAHRIEDLAHAFVDPSNQPSLAIGGGSAGAHTSGEFNLKAIYALNLLANNLNKVGGVRFNPDSPLESLNSDDVLSKGRAAGLKEWQDLAGAGVGAVVIRGANPSHGLIKDANFTSLMDNASFIATFASSMDETASKSNLVLPELNYLETWGDNIPNPGPGYQTFGLQQPVVTPFNENASSFADEIIKLSENLGLDLVSKLGIDDDKTLHGLIRNGAQELWSQGRGSVKSATFEGFWQGVLQRGGWWDVNATKVSSGTVNAIDASWPTIEFGGEKGEGSDVFHLIPFISNSIADGSLANLPWLQATPDPVTSMTWHAWVEINRETAEEMNIKEADVLELSAGGVTVKGPAYIHPAVPPWTVSMPFGQGHYTGEYSGGVGENVLAVVSSLADKDTGSLAWAATRVKVKNLGNTDGERVPKMEGTVEAYEAEERYILQITGPNGDGKGSH